jgi:hypothetical protein
MTEQKLVEKMARAMWEDYMIDPQHNGAEMPTWEMLLAGTDRPSEFPEFVNMHRQAMSQARAVRAAIREAGCAVVPVEAPDAWVHEMIGGKGYIQAPVARMWRTAYRAMIAASPIGEK